MNSVPIGSHIPLVVCRIFQLSLIGVVDFPRLWLLEVLPQTPHYTSYRLRGNQKGYSFYEPLTCDFRLHYSSAQKPYFAKYTVDKHLMLKMY